MMKRIREKRLNGIVVLSPKGNLTGGDETDELRDALKALLEQEVSCVVINFLETEFITSMALGVLIAAHASFTKRERRINLCNLDKKIWNLLVITRLSLTFDVYEDEEKAIAGCAATKIGPPSA
jgi:anti-anti-sigma factor